MSAGMRRMSLILFFFIVAAALLIAVWVRSTGDPFAGLMITASDFPGSKVVSVENRRQEQGCVRESRQALLPEQPSLPNVLVSQQVLLCDSEASSRVIYRGISETLTSENAFKPLPNVYAASKGDERSAGCYTSADSAGEGVVRCTLIFRYGRVITRLDIRAAKPEAAYDVLLQASEVLLTKENELYKSGNPDIVDEPGFGSE
jgi:hypothetical protein